MYSESFLYGFIAKCAELKVDPVKVAESLCQERSLDDYEDYAEYVNDNSLDGHGKRTCPGCSNVTNCRCSKRANHQDIKLLCADCFNGQVKEAGKGDSYGCAMIYFEDCSGDTLKNWNDDLKLMDIDPDDLHEQGMEDEPHVTVLYGLHTEEASDVEDTLKEHNKDGEIVTFRMGNLDLFENDDFDVLIRKVDEAHHLHDLRKVLLDNMEATVTFPDYKPHATIAYLKKGKGKEYIEKLKDVKFNIGTAEIDCSTLDFSNKECNHTKMPLLPK